MINLRTRKIWRDLWGQKARTALVALTIAVGIFAVGGLSRIWLILGHNLSDNYLAANPASAIISTQQVFNEDLVEEIRNLPEVAEAEGVNNLTGRILIGPNRWRRLTLIARADYNDLTLDKIRAEAGPWPPPRRAMLLERSSLRLDTLTLDSPVTLELENGKRTEITLAGTVYDIIQIPSPFAYMSYGYVTPETMEQLGGSRGYNRLHFTVAAHSLDKAHIERVVETVSDKLEASGLIILNKEIPEPGQPKMHNIVQSVLLLLGLLSGWALVLNTFLVVNIISAQLTQQTGQIGTLKTIGGHSRQITAMYLKTVALFGLLALAVAVPINLGWSRLNAAFFARMLNFDITSFQVPAQVYLLEITAGVLIPCLIALYPILRSTRMTIREAIGRAGAQMVQFGNHGFERLLGVLRGLPSIILYAGRNVFRRKVRLVLAVLALSVAGAIFIAVTSVRASFRLTIEGVAAYWQQDIRLVFYDPHRFKQLQRQILQISGVSQAEPRLVKTAFRVYPDGSDSTQTLDVFGLEPRSEFIRPYLLAGRWLEPDDTNSVVVNVDLLDLEPDVAVGEALSLDIEGRETHWQVVGLVTSQVVGSRVPLMAPIAYVNYPILAGLTGDLGRANQVLIATERHDPAAQAEVAQRLEANFEQRGLPVAVTSLNADVRAALENAFEILLSVLQIMSLIFGVVGGLGLMSMMSLNVLERTREIGIIRSIGGIRRQLAQMVIIEGVTMGLLSWLAGTLLAYPLSRFLSNILGNTLLRVPLNHTFPLSGPLLWLGIVIILAVISSLIPARSASRLSIRETLSYE